MGWMRQGLASRRGLPDRVVGPLSDAAHGLRIRHSLYRKAVQVSDGSEIEFQTASRDVACSSTPIVRGKGRNKGPVLCRKCSVAI